MACWLCPVLSFLPSFCYGFCVPIASSLRACDLCCVFLLILARVWMVSCLDFFLRFGFFLRLSVCVLVFSRYVLWLCVWLFFFCVHRVSRCPCFFLSLPATSITLFGALAVLIRFSFDLFSAAYALGVFFSASLRLVASFFFFPFHYYGFFWASPRLFPSFGFGFLFLHVLPIPPNLSSPSLPSSGSAWSGFGAALLRVALLHWCGFLVVACAFPPS